MRVSRFVGLAVVAALAAAGSAAWAQTPNSAAGAGSRPSTAQLDGRTIFGPAPPVAPEVIARDDSGRATVRAVRVSGPFVFDGRLDDEVYRTVPPLTGFIQSLPDIGQPVSQKTEAWVFYDDLNFYVACRCSDTAPPSQWVANEMRRDGNQLRQNDNFGVVLDTYYDRRNGINLYANPLGGMMDIQITNEGNNNQDWNMIWDARTARFDGGWSMEVRIPFKSLRYRPGVAQMWGMQLRRSIRRRGESSYLTALPPDGGGAWTRISLSPTLVGVEVPPMGRNLDIKPYAIGGVKTDRIASPAIQNDPNGEFGLDVKYGLTPNITLDATYNTDFAQVEVDEQQVNLTRFNLVFPEKREFFLEGRGLYEFGHAGRGLNLGVSTSTLPELFFTRQIGLNAGRVVPIVAGARLTGKVGSSSFGALNIQTDEETVSKTPRTNFTVLRYRRDLLRRSTFGVMMTNRSASTVRPGESNQAYGADAVFSFYQNLNFNGFYARTNTPGLEGGADSYLAHFDLSPDRYGIAAEHQYIGTAFNPEVGFVRRGNMRRTFASARFSPRPKAMASIRRFSYDASVENITDASGTLESRQQGASFSTEFRNSDIFNVEYTRNFELLREPFRVSSGVDIPGGEYTFNSVQATYNMGQQRKVSGIASFGTGEFYDGRQTQIGYSMTRVEITPQFSAEPSLSVNWVSLPYGDFTAQLYRARVTYTFTPRMFLSGLLQYNLSNDTVGTNIRLRWEYLPGSEFFVVYTEDRDTARPGQVSGLRNRGVTIKFNRLLRF